MTSNGDKLERVLTAISIPDEESRPGAGRRLPALTLIDEDEGVVSLPGALSGPLLLVFFRGFW